jgi:hypothetical protein
MSNGGAKHKIWGPYWDNTNSTIYTNIYVYAYVAGAYSVGKNFWTDEDKSTPVTSRQGDNTGTVDGYFDGLYNIRIKASDDSTVIKSYPNVKITADSATMYEDNIGTSVPSSTNANKGHLFAEVDSNDNFERFWINQGADDSTSFVSLLGEQVFNVRHFGAVGDGSTDDATAIQNAINAIPATGGGLYFPASTSDYLIVAAMNIDNKPIHIFGDGKGLSRIRQDTASNGIIDYDTDDVNDAFIISDISLTCDVAAAGDAINCNYPTTTSSQFGNFLAKNIEIVPKFGSEATKYFDNGIVLDNGHNANITACTITGKEDTATASTQGIKLTDCRRVKISDCTIQFFDEGVDATGNCEYIDVSGNTIYYVNDGVTIASASGEDKHKICGNFIDALVNGILVGLTANLDNVTIQGNDITINSNAASTAYGMRADVINSNIDGNTITDDSAQTTFGVHLQTNADENMVTDNIIKSCTTGIDINTGCDKNHVCNNSIFTATDGILVVGDTNIIKSNLTDTCTTGITLSGDSNFMANNYMPSCTTESSITGSSNIARENWPQLTLVLSDTTDTTPSIKDMGNSNGLISLGHTSNPSMTTFDDGYDGQTVHVYNSNTEASGNNITLIHGGGAPVTGFDLTGASNLVLGPKDGTSLFYISSIGVWRQISETTN